MTRILPFSLIKSKTAFRGTFLPSHVNPLKTPKKRFNSIVEILLSLFCLFRSLFPFRSIEWMTEAQVQLTLNLSWRDLRNLSDSGKIPFEELCGDYYYKFKDIQRFLKREKKRKKRDLPLQYFSWREWPSSLN